MQYKVQFLTYDFYAMYSLENVIAINQGMSIDIVSNWIHLTGKL